MPNEEARVLWPGWETGKVLGRGSFGAVYEIHREVFGDTEKAALKLITIPQSSSEIDELYGEGYDDESISNTFKLYLKSIVAEYSLMRKLNGSANVVNCDDVRCVQHEDGFGWDIFIKMELLTPLNKALPREIPDETVIRIGTDLCKALVLCKKHNIVHRDIKPANIFVSDNGDYKLGDFGIAKTVEKTSGGTKTGTYDYMAPEVYLARPYGSAVDIYSLGMVLYWLLNERRTPFLALPPALPTGIDKEQARSRRFSGEPIPAPAHGSPALQRIVLKAIAFDPRDRYQSAEDMLRDLEALAYNAEFGMRNSELNKDATVPPVGPSIARPPLATTGPRMNEAPAAARGPHPPQAVPLPPAGGRQGADISRPLIRETPDPDRRGDPCGRPPVSTTGPHTSEPVGAIAESPAPDAAAANDADATVGVAHAPVEPSIARPPVADPGPRVPGASAAARGPHPPQAVPLPPAGGRQGPSRAPAPINGDATVGAIHTTAPAAIDRDATVSAIHTTAPAAIDRDATVSAIHTTAPAAIDREATVSAVHAAPTIPPQSAAPAWQQPAAPVQPRPTPPAQKPPAPPPKPGKKKWLPILIGAAALVLAVVVILVLIRDRGEAASLQNVPSAAATSANDSSPELPKAAGGRVGVSLPAKSLQRWDQDGKNMKKELEAAGYTVDLQFAENSVATQVSQIENMIDEGCKVLVIASVDSDSLSTVLAKAKEAGIPVIAYDRLIMNSDAVSYYVTFDNWLVGVRQGEFIRDALDLDNAIGPFNIEFITGDPDDNNINFYYDGALWVLQPYLDSGKLVCPSGQVEKAVVATANWATDVAQARFENILSAYYADGTPLHAVLASNDSIARGVENALESSYVNDVYPIITGQDCDMLIMENLIEGKQTMSVFKDTRVLVSKTVEMVDALMKGQEPPINDTVTYDNGTGAMSSWLCEPVVCTVENYYELLVGPGYYTADQLR